MKHQFTHTADLVNLSTGKRRTVQCYQTAETWVVGTREYYYRKSGHRAGGMGQGGTQLDIHSVKEIK